MSPEKKRIYIADDDESIRQVIRTFLINDGYLTEDFPTGDALYERFEAEPMRSCDTGRNDARFGRLCDPNEAP